MENKIITIIWFLAFNKIHTEVFDEKNAEALRYYQLKISHRVGTEIRWLDAWQFSTYKGEGKKLF